jgi:putative pyruvate formate lyase activating enzyme
MCSASSARELPVSVDRLAPLPTSCDLCPRACHANRAAGQRGYCGAGDELRVARAALHFWEEPPISGAVGSGAVFFSHCSLRCAYCQNLEISQGTRRGVVAGRDISVGRLAQIFIELQEQGALNINLVTPSHYRLQVVDALHVAREAGLAIPVVYNTSGYETVESIRALSGLVDIYLTDFKYVSSRLSARLSDAPDYFEVAAAALDEMVAQVGPYTLSSADLDASPPADASTEDPGPPLARGVVVRHLMLPGQLADSQAVVSHVYGRYGDDVCLSLMNQFTPRKLGPAFSDIERRVSEEEYSDLVDFALGLGVENSFMQEGGTAEESFIPPFDETGV